MAAWVVEESRKMPGAKPSVFTASLFVLKVTEQMLQNMLDTFTNGCLIHREVLFVFILHL